SKIEAITNCFVAIATREFATNPVIRALPKSSRRLSVMLSGFWNTTAGCIPAGWIITNYQRNFDLGAGAPDSRDPWSEFKCWRWHESVPSSSTYAHVERLGQWNGVRAEAFQRLKTLLWKGLPPHALLGSALKVMHAASDSEKTIGTVGKQISIVIVPMNISEPIQFCAESSVV